MRIIPFIQENESIQLDTYLKFFYDYHPEDVAEEVELLNKTVKDKLYMFCNNENSSED